MCRCVPAPGIPEPEVAALALLTLCSHLSPAPPAQGPPGALPPAAQQDAATWPTKALPEVSGECCTFLLWS